MADLIDVANTLAGIAAGAVYPNGTGQPSAAGVPASIFVGWPISQQLQTALGAGGSQVSVFPRQEETNTTRFMQAWVQTSVSVPSLTATLGGQSVTIGGTPPVAGNPQNVSVIVNGAAYVYAAQIGDTPNVVAAALATLIVAGVPGTSSAGAVVTMPSSARVASARIGLGGTAVKEIRRQVRRFQVSIWAPKPADRDALSRVIDLAFAALEFVTLPDLTAGRLIYVGSNMSDGFEKLQLYRRDLFYSVEYGTVLTESETQITQTQIGVAAAPGGVAPYVTAATIIG